MILTTTQVTLLNEYFALFQRATIANWNYLLAPDAGATFETYGYSTVYHIYQTQDLIASMFKIVGSYYSLSNQSLDRFEYFYTDNQQQAIAPVVMDVTYFAQRSNIFDFALPFDASLVTERYFLTNSTDIGPFNPDPMANSLRKNDSLQTYIHYVNTITISLSVKNFNYARDMRSCITWDVTSKQRMEMDI